MSTSRANHRVFISHSHQDNELVRDIARRLRDAGFEPVVLSENIGIGGDLKNCIRQGIRDADTVLFLLTPASVASDWTMTELGIAEGLDRHVLPITIGVTRRELPAPLQTYRTVPFDRLDKAISQLSDKLSMTSR